MVKIKTNTGEPFKMNETQSPTVTRATIHRTMFSTWITAEMSDGTESKLFDYFRDEILFSPREFIGKTKAEALAMKFNRDRNSLR
tara:strand:- start:376 stop:630 length:255 start_codon:yes stop_codon:yes gene_type:complete